ncbi:MAG TPA: amino acid adenylation domain-containing protein, partial [Prolixibacteraceae bacterium]|nr:amino acid adenylation domain-containing protein [Prolixibacteraceae bacterium]
MSSTLNLQEITNIINHPVCEPLGVHDVLSSFNEVSGKFPENRAIFDSGRSYTYRELSQDVEKLSFVLRNAGIKEGDVVAVIIDRHYHYFVSILATLNCAAAFLPVDPAFPEERIAFFCQDAAVSCILSDVRQTDLVDTLKVLNVPECLKSKSPANAQSTPCHPESPAYIIYTSGSTGKPKGVKISRKALANFVSGIRGLYQISEEDRILQFSNLSFDACMEEIFGAFCSGASLYLRTSEMLLAEELIGFSVQHQITIWDLPTAFWRQVIGSEEYQVSQLPQALRIVIIGGEAVSVNDVATWNLKKADHKLFNTYGPTETTVVALAYEIKAGYTPEKLVPIGRPLPGYRIYITDPDRNLVPQGTTGELLITGDSVALGYVNRELEQDRAFIWFNTPDNGLQWCYCTGDLVRADEEGLVLYQGRVDRQFKIRGFKVELSEIETVLSTYDGIRENTVIVREDHSSEKKLVAYLVKDHKMEIDLADLRQFIKQKLPEFMHPSAFVLLDKFPLTPNGKLDTRALPAPDQYNGLNAEVYVAPKSNTEIKLALTWSEILNIEKVGVQDNFFDLGGNSLV